MPVSDELLDRAQRLDPPAVEALLADAYPLVCRTALALSGREDVTRRVVSGVLERGLRVLPGWRRGVAPENWFYHHTVITAREAVGSAAVHPDPAGDPLVTHAPAADAGYVAFIRAVRGLDPQQAEAFILHHGERLNARMLGVAMDCSAQAADNHLRAATAALGVLAGDDLAKQAAALTRAYAALGATPAEAIAAVRPLVRRMVRARRARRIARLVTTLVVLAILAAVGYGLWHWRGTIFPK